MKTKTPLQYRIPPAATVLALVLAAGVGHAKDAALLALPMEHFRDSAAVTTDSGGHTTISTEAGFVDRNGLRTVWIDEFLTGIIDDRTEKLSAHVEVLITYSGPPRQYETASYAIAGATQTVPLTLIDKSSKNCVHEDCTYTEHLSYPIDEQALRQIAADYLPSKAAVWPNALVSKSARSTGGLSNAEVAGFLAKVDQLTHRASGPASTAPMAGPSLGTPVAADAAAAPLTGTSAAAAPATIAPVQIKLDFGVAGLPLAGTEENPVRAGVLITTVTHGSVAQKAGVIAGDVLYELSQRPIKTIADLQAALAASPAGSNVVFKVYRGLDSKVLAAHF